MLVCLLEHYPTAGTSTTETATTATTAEHCHRGTTDNFFTRGPQENEDIQQSLVWIKL